METHTIEKDVKTYRILHMAPPDDIKGFYFVPLLWINFIWVKITVVKNITETNKQTDGHINGNGGRGV